MIGGFPLSSRWFPLIVVLIVVFIGHFFTRFTLFRYKQKYIVTDEFRDKFVDLVNYYTEHYRVNQEMYAECIQQVNTIQEELGEDGIIAMFSDPLKKIQGQNFQLLVNVMPDMKLFERHLDSSIIRERMQHLFELCDDALLKHLGFLQRQIENEKRTMWNPFICFGKGTRWFVGLPFDILYWCGIISAPRKDAIYKSRGFTFVENFITLIGLVSSIMGIVLGWDEFINLFLP